MDECYEPHWSNYLNQFDLPSSYFQNIPTKTNKFCVIIEPRKMEILIKVIKNFMYLLQNKGWGLIVVHGTDNEEFVKSGLSGWKNVHYIKLNVPNLTPTTFDRLLTGSTLFWDKLLKIGCEKSLFFQSDAVLLKDNVDDFINYDYVGAPWPTNLFRQTINVGNGGLSLRDTSTMIEIINSCKNICTHEDVYFGYGCIKLNKKVPTIEEAMKFSVETIYYNDPCGMHKPQIERFPSYQHYAELLSKKHVS